MSLLNETITTKPKIYRLVEQRGDFNLRITVIPHGSKNGTFEYAIMNTFVLNDDPENPAILWRSATGPTHINCKGSVRSTEAFLFLIKSTTGDQTVDISVRDNNKTPSSRDDYVRSSGNTVTLVRAQNQNVYDDYYNNSYYGMTGNPIDNGNKSSNTSSFFDFFHKITMAQWVFIALAAVMLYYFLRRGMGDSSGMDYGYDAPLLDTPPLRSEGLSYRSPRSYGRDALYRTSI